MSSSPPVSTLAIFIDWFAPGFKAGGPIRSIVNLSHLLKSDASIYIFTSDRDHGDTTPYPNVVTDTWTSWDKHIKVWYSSPDQRKSMMAEVRTLEPDAVYLNSLFSVHFSIIPLWHHRRKALAERVVLVPRGMLHAGALQYGKRKKQLFLSLLKLSGVPQRLIWQATDNQERADISRHIGAKTEIIDVGNVPTIFSAPNTSIVKKAGELSLLFVSRIQPKKNLEFLIERLSILSGKVSLDIIGPVEDDAYWQTVQAMISALPESHTVKYLGALPHQEIMDRLQQYHLFCLPTHGENFGHAIFDAMIGGLPILISDQTPWQTSAQNQFGWTLPLSEIPPWNAALQQAMSWDQGAFEKASQHASLFARQYIADSQLKQKYLTLFFPEDHE